MPAYLQIQPAQLIQIISKIKINVLHMEINSNATIQVLAYSEDNQLLTSYVFELNLPEYDYWRDDDYLVDYVCQKYGFALINNIV
jgi:hypothetical protein